MKKYTSYLGPGIAFSMFAFEFKGYNEGFMDFIKTNPTYFNVLSVHMKSL